ncbi:MAG TPA: hypothetical protein VMF89_26900 [Polyangiales bacterium]|nr:hypothetical protein [Polyangiales bacterium]
MRILGLCLMLCACTGSETLVRPDTLRTTCGELAAREDQRFEVSDACFRAVGTTPASVLRLDFTYLGASAQAVPLASGELRQQVGLKLRAQDTCNVVYVMWHIAPAPRIEVSVKHNPGMSEHVQCRDAGYTFIKGDAVHAAPIITSRSSHSLQAQLDGTALRVRADDQLVWQGQLPSAALLLAGPSGVRSDNVHLLMQLHAKL